MILRPPTDARKGPFIVCRRTLFREAGRSRHRGDSIAGWRRPRHRWGRARTDADAGSSR